MARLGFLLLSVALFSLPAWAPMVFVAWPAEFIDQKLMFPQLNFVLYAAPALKEGWPGPLGVNMLESHRQLMMLAYGLTGAVIGHFAFKLNDWWMPRLVWTFMSWMVWVGVMFVLGGLVTFGAGS